MYRPSAVAPNWQREPQPPAELQAGTFQVAATASCMPLPPPPGSPLLLASPLLPPPLIRQTNMRPSLDLLARREPGRKRCSEQGG